MARGVGGRGPANIMHHIAGINFPATKEEIIEIAKSHADEDGYPDTSEVLDILQQLPEEEYASPAQILERVGEVE